MSTALPPTVEFDYVLRDDLDLMERLADIEQQAGLPVDSDLRDRVQENLFYEVRVRCSLDTTTGQITILSTEAVR